MATQTALELVNEKFDQMQDLVTGTWQSAWDAVNRLQVLAGELALINTTLSIDSTTFDTPDYGNIEVPEVPSLSFNAPNEPAEPSIETVDTDTSSITFPNVSVGTIGQPSQTYVSALLTLMKSKLTDSLSGVATVPGSIEDAIWYRENERALLAHDDSKERIVAEWSKRRLPLPDGVLTAQLEEAELNFVNKRLDMSRDISIKTFELEFQGYQIALQYSMGIEAQIMNWTRDLANLSFQVSDAVIKNQLENYKGDVSSRDAQIRRVLETARAKIEQNRSAIQLYAGKVEAYSAKLRAETEKINGQAKIYDTQSNVFRGLSDFEIAKAGLNVKIAEALITQNINNANLLLKDAEIRGKNAEMLNALKVEALKAMATIGAQLAAGALSSVSAAATAGVDTKYTHSYNEKDRLVTGAGEVVTTSG